MPNMARAMQPISSVPPQVLSRIRVLAADIDDTITSSGHLPASTIESLADLGAAGLVVALVTGRPAGWAQALASYLPGVSVAVAENGLVAFYADGKRVDLGPKRDAKFFVRLAENGTRVREAYRLEPTPDDAFRLFERAFVRPATFDAAALAASQRVVDPDFEVMASSIHLHVRPGGWGKADGLIAALRPLAPEAAGTPEQSIMFVGDSSNDRSLFALLTQTSVGVRNLEKFLGELGDDRPAYITRGESARGFAEVARLLLEHRTV